MSEIRKFLKHGQKQLLYNILLTYSNTMYRKGIFYDKEIVNTILLIKSLHIVFQPFLISQLVYNNNMFVQSKLIEESRK